MIRTVTPASCIACDTHDRMCRNCVEVLFETAEIRAKEVRAAIVSAQIAEAMRVTNIAMAKMAALGA